MQEDITLKIAGIYGESIVDGPGFRFAIFCQGCPHHCEGCHNPETWPFEGGKDIPIKRIAEEVAKDPIITGVTFSGGEPFSQAWEFYQLGLLLKDMGLHLLAFTGYRYEELAALAEGDEGIRNLLGILDTLIDGRFELDKRDISLKFRGSTNQRIIDMKATRECGEVVLDDRYM